ncbi:MAG: glycosyltransferase family 39 protein [Candidatus Latescibacter sp.]|nr:glycosyltransferase family 39 protein [Candidatus Latescibacter sp.]
MAKRILPPDQGKRPRPQTAPVVVSPPGIVKAAEKIEPWFPWAAAAVFFIIMAWLTFRYHTVGGLGVETDFYAELYPTAKQLLAGHFSPSNYGAKGPVYSFLLAGFYLVVRDFFTAGLLLNLVSASLFLPVLYFLVRTVFNKLTAVFTLFAVMSNYMFLHFTYQAGSDMPFMLICALSLFFLFRGRGKLDLVLSAVFGMIAFLTRYNGAFIVAGAAVFYIWSEEALAGRLKKLGIWLAVFVAAGLPWFIPNALTTGNPIHNDNYVNVMMDYYGLGKAGVTYENWTDALPKQFTGIGDIILYNPVYFTRHTLSNMAGHFLNDMKELVNWRLGVFVITGMILLLVSIRPIRSQIRYFTFGVFYFLILAIVFYNARFSLFLLAMYIPAAVWPFTVRIRPRFLRWFSRLMLAGLVLTTFSGAVINVPKLYKEIQQSPTFLKDLGLALGKAEPDKSQKIIARKPHTAYYAGLNPVMFPEKPRTIEELVKFCHEQKVRYILYSVIEAGARPYLRGLITIDDKFPGLREVYHNEFGIIYRVE